MNREKKRITDRAYEQRLREKGIKVHSFRLNNEEFENVKKFIETLRKNTIKILPCKHCGRMPALGYQKVDAEENGKQTKNIAYIMSCEHCHQGYIVFNNIALAYETWNNAQEQIERE